MPRRDLDALRRGLLGGAGLAAAALVGCGGDDDDDEPAASSTSASGDAGTGATTSSTATTTTASESTATAASDTAEAVEPVGKLVQDPNLPYPYNYPEPAKTPKPGGIMKVAATWNYQTIDPITSAAGGTMTIPNMVYNRLLGIVRGPAADPFQMQLEPELAASWERTPDGLEFTFNITPGITWQNLPPLNSRPFVAEDARSWPRTPVSR